MGTLDIKIRTIPLFLFILCFPSSLVSENTSEDHILVSRSAKSGGDRFNPEKYEFSTSGRQYLIHDDGTAELNGEPTQFPILVFEGEWIHQLDFIDLGSLAGDLVLIYEVGNHESG